MSNNSGNEPVERKSAPQAIGMVRFTEWASDRVVAKRKRRGLGDLKPRKKNAMRQILTNGIVLSLANVAVAPLERCRIILQTAPMSTYQHELPGTTRGLIPYIMSTQGQTGLWRGVMPHIYKQWGQVLVKVAFYDRIKNSIMPYSASKYSGLDYFIRAQSAAVFCMGITTAMTYPFDLLHTRLSADVTPKGRQRIYSSTFQCFNRTNLDEGRFACYKGLEFAVAAALLRSMVQMPVYDTVKFMADKAGIEQDGMMGTFTQRFGASVFSGLLLSTLLYPLDTFKRNSQLNGGIGYRKAFADPFECTQYVFKENKGNMGLYRGVGTFAVTQIMLAFVQFSLFDLLNGRFRPAPAKDLATGSGQLQQAD